MKRNILYLFLSSILILNACIDPLDKEPLGIISESAVFTDEALAQSYLNDMYDRIPWWQQFRTGTGNGWENDAAMIGCMAGECNTKGPWQQSYAAALHIYDETGADHMDYWPYVNIRKANFFMEEVSASSSLSDEFKTRTIAEARFLRAYMYFEMVKRFGGVPILTETIGQDASEDELFLPRNTEKEVYDFVISELNELADIFPESYDISGYGRPTKFTALGFVSRAALYAASIAKFGEVQINGIVGIPAGDADSYYQKSIQASEAIINSGMFSLYNKDADPAQNFQNLFTDDNENPEVIFVERYDIELNKIHFWDAIATSQGFNANGWNSNFHSYLELME